MDVCGVHLDRRAGMAHVEEITGAIRAEGRQALFFNVNAADHERRRQVLDALASRIAEDGDGTVGVLMHSLAFGSLAFLNGQIIGKAWMVLLALPAIVLLRRRDERLGLKPV